MGPDAPAMNDVDQICPGVEAAVRLKGPILECGIRKMVSRQNQTGQGNGLSLSNQAILSYLQHGIGSPIVNGCQARVSMDRSHARDEGGDTPALIDEVDSETSALNLSPGSRINPQAGTLGRSTSLGNGPPFRDWKHLLLEFGTLSPEGPPPFR